MKAILVLDEMPTSCLLCPVFELESGICRVTGEDNLFTDTSSRRLKGCPLKPLPQKMEEELGKEFGYTPTGVMKHIQKEVEKL